MRRSTLLWVVSALTSLGLAAPAGASVGATSITSPADPAFRVYNADLGADAAANRLTVSGRADTSSPATDRVDLRCFWTDSGGSLRANTLALQVPLAADGSFSVTTDPATLSSNPFGSGTQDDAPGVQTCRLRATPAVAALTDLDTGALPDWAGPRINVARFGSTTLGVRGGGNVTVDYGVGAGGLRGQAEWSSRCGTFSFRPYVNAAALSPALLPNWDCVGALLPPDAGDAGSQVRVDGVAAYTGSSAPSFDFDANPGTPAERPTGASGLSVDVRRGTLTGTVTTVERFALQRCAQPTFPPTAASCPSLVATGVEVERQTKLDDDGLQSTVFDTLRSVDGAAHDVERLPEQYVVFDTDPVFRFPGEDAFAPHGPGDQPTLGPPGVPASAFTRDAVTPDTPRQGTGAESWGVAPADLRFFGEDFQYRERIPLRVPAGSGTTSTRVFRVARTLEEATAGARAAEARLTPPPAPTPPPVATPAPVPAAARCRVPRLSRSSLYGTARSKIKRAGCAVGKVRRVRSSIKRGRVVRTRPGGAAKVPAGTRVAIDLSDGKARAPKRKAATKKRTSARASAVAVQHTGAPAHRTRPTRNARPWVPR